MNYRICAIYPYTVIKTEEKGNSDYIKLGYFDEIYTNEGFAKYISLCYQREECSRQGEFKKASSLRLRIKYILWEFPEYKL